MNLPSTLFKFIILVLGISLLNNCTYFSKGKTEWLSSLSVMSFNIRYDNPKDSLDAWSLRKSEVLELIDAAHPDFLGMQEGLHNQVLFLDENLANYEFIGVGRDDGHTKGEYSAIFYDTSKFNLIDQNTFWLSENPDSISVGWDASMERICTYGYFQDKKGDQGLYVFNTHFDHLGRAARSNSAVLILEKIKTICPKNASVILMGDFNALPLMPPIRTLANYLHEPYRYYKKIEGPPGTFNSFDPNTIPDRRLDYIFYRNLTLQSYIHDNTKRRNGRWPSDHLPVQAEFGE